MIPLYAYLLEHDLFDDALTINIEEGKNSQIHSDKWDEELKLMFPNITVTHQQVDWEEIHLKTWKYDEQGEISSAEAKSFREYVLAQLDIKETTPKIILIERSKDSNNINRPGEYSNQNIKHIKNHQALRSSLEHELSNRDFEFCNVFCENLTFREQVELFFNASAVVAQHGAALINLIWMKPNTQVVEYSIGRDFYWTKIISDVYGVNHTEIHPINSRVGENVHVTESEVPVDLTLELIRGFLWK